MHSMPLVSRPFDGPAAFLAAKIEPMILATVEFEPVPIVGILAALADGSRRETGAERADTIDGQDVDNLADAPSALAAALGIILRFRYRPPAGHDSTP
jgi:hypothetical protein